MPVLQLYYPQGALAGEHKADLAQRFTDVLLGMEGGAKTPGGLAFATVLFTEVPSGDWWVGGRTDATHVKPPGKFLVRVSIPEGYMSQSNKSDVHAAVKAAIVAVAGDPSDPQQGANVLVTIEEVTEGNWGARGKTISLASIADSVGLKKSGERFKWVKAYFAAKARQFAAAGYPADTGGLLPDGSEIVRSR
ncbi:MAG TPA: tautomerase family protein [Steroidobacteraceae bacterium]|jgi:phenylpyruvate tautomerase PptA (4-oxalocrotonate tautomerase family)|nr:tautomerase family protein [Steroidobacteraceae bacterium]